MSETTTKVYVGRTEERTNKFGEAEVKISFGPKDFDTLKEHTNDKGWVTFSLKTSKDGKLYLQVWPAQKPKGDLPF